MTGRVLYFAYVHLTAATHSTALLSHPGKPANEFLES